MKKIILITLLLAVGLAAIAAEPGCDWWVRTNGHWNQSQTSWGKRCSDIEWVYPDGSPIPEADIVCCNFDEHGNYDGTGINCGAGAGMVRLPEGSTIPDEWSGGSPDFMLPKRTGLHGNWMIDKDFKVAIDKMGNVGVYRLGLKESALLFNISERYEKKPINLSVIATPETVKIVVTPLENKVSKLDTSGSEYITYQTSELKKEVYEKNVSGIIQLYPNPVVQGTNIKVTALNAGVKTSISVYTQSGKLVQQSNVGTEGFSIDTQKWDKGMYYYSLIVDGVKIKGGMIAVE